MALVYSPNSTAKKLLISFASLFDKIEVTSRDKGKYLIPVRLGTREKIYSMTQVTDETRNKFRYSLPLMGFAVNSLSFDTGRATNQLNTLSSTSRDELMRNTVPYNFSIELYILANRSSELFEILEIILPMYAQARYFPMIETKFTDGSMITRDIPIILESNAIELKGDLAANEEQVFSATLSFTLKANLYNPFIKVDASIIPPWSPSGNKDGWILDPNGGVGSIKQIDLTFEELISNSYDRLLGDITITEGTGGTITETISGDL